MLVAAYGFPPVGGAGVQRVLKLVKYLPAHGVTPTVLTVANPSVPVRDATLERDFPRELEIMRVRTLEPPYGKKAAAWKARAAPSEVARLTRAVTAVAKQLLVPDPQILWQPAAQAALAMQLVRNAPDVVFVSGPPFSQFLLAPLARLRKGVGVVLDYRDEWSTYRTTYEMMGSLAARVADSLEPALLRSAHAVTTATDEFRAHLLARFPFLDPARVHTIPNGYDPDDFASDLTPPPEGRLVVTYAGTIFKLTSARGLMGAIRRLHREEPGLAARLEVRFLGRIVDTEADAFVGMERCGVRRLGYVSHGEVLRQLAASHLALCLLDDVPGVERIYPAKIFELMHLGRPCLTLSPEGALTRLVRKHGLGEVIAPRDEEAIARYLANALRTFVHGAPSSHTPRDEAGIGRYHRHSLAGEFANVMRLARACAS